MFSHPVLRHPIRRSKENIRTTPDDSRENGLSGSGYFAPYYFIVFQIVKNWHVSLPTDDWLTIRKVNAVPATKESRCGAAGGLCGDGASAVLESYSRDSADNEGVSVVQSCTIL